MTRSVSVLIGTTLGLLLLLSCSMLVDAERTRRAKDMTDIDQSVVDLIPDPEDPDVAQYLKCSVCVNIAQELDKYFPKVRERTKDPDELLDEADKLCEEVYSEYGLRFVREADPVSGDWVEDGRKEVWPEYDAGDEQATIQDGWAHDVFKMRCLEVTSDLNERKALLIAKNAEKEMKEIKKKMKKMQEAMDRGEKVDADGDDQEEQEEEPFQPAKPAPPSFTRKQLCGKCKIYSEFIYEQNAVKQKKYDERRKKQNEKLRTLHEGAEKDDADSEEEL